MRRIALYIVLLCFLLTACGSGASPAASTGDASPVVPVVAVSEIVVGKNRMTIGLIRNNSPVNDPNAKVRLRFYNLSDTSAQVQSEADATYYGQGLPAALYVAYPEFDKAGDWAVEVQTQLTGQSQPSTQRQRFVVLEKSNMPNIGDPAIAVKTPTVADTPVEQLSSGKDPNPVMYQISLDDALKSGKPTAVLFATPGYCRTAMCGPNIKVMEELQTQYGDSINFVHVEVYKYPFDASFEAQAKLLSDGAVTPDEAKTGFSDGMLAWRLFTEPWLYLIDKNGTIVSRYEGGITQEEIGPALKQLVAG